MFQSTQKTKLNNIEQEIESFYPLRKLEREYYRKKEELYFDFQRYRRQTITNNYITSEKLIDEIRQVEQLRQKFLDAKGDIPRTELVFD